MTNFEKAVKAVGVAGIVEMMSMYCYEATGSTCSACPWRKALNAVPGCKCLDSGKVITFLESEAGDDDKRR